MSLIQYVYHHCKITGKPCVNGSCKECPPAIGNLVSWCKNFQYHNEEVAEADEHDVP